MPRSATEITLHPERADANVADPDEDIDYDDLCILSRSSTEIALCSERVDTDVADPDEDIDYDDLCIFCQEAPSSVILPCNHQCHCEKCYQIHKTDAETAQTYLFVCPYCHMAIHEIVHSAAQPIVEHQTDVWLEAWDNLLVELKMMGFEDDVANRSMIAEKGGHLQDSVRALLQKEDE